jgi:hypothetical protein
MEDPQQTKLYKEAAGEISPLERGLYLGTSGWTYADWEGTVYPPETPPTGRHVTGLVASDLQIHLPSSRWLWISR